jgi:ABC-type transporter Mla subunit MlaD
MKDHIEHRLHQLQQELASGQQLMADLEQRQQNLRETLLRIGGAIQVLQELLQEIDTPSGGPRPLAEAGGLPVSEGRASEDVDRG